MVIEARGFSCPGSADHDRALQRPQIGRELREEHVPTLAVAATDAAARRLVAVQRRLDRKRLAPDPVQPHPLACGPTGSVKPTNQML
jgi:hypothetical protein